MFLQRAMRFEAFEKQKTAKNPRKGKAEVLDHGSHGYHVLTTASRLHLFECFERYCSLMVLHRPLLPFLVGRRKEREPSLFEPCAPAISSSTLCAYKESF